MNTLNIIKVGGNIIDNETKLLAFLKDFSELKGYKILIHGGGKVATELGKKIGIESQMAEGRRITDAETLKLVTMVYAGLINKNIVARLQAHHCNAIGLTGADANTIPAQKRKAGAIDYGFVGDPLLTEFNGASLLLFLQNNLVPVVAPITHDQKGQLLNTNADTIASTLAVGLSKDFQVNLFYCFEKKGVLKDIENEDTFITSINPASYEQLKAEGYVHSGMLPKLDNAFAAIQAGVKSVYICHADNLKKIINEGKAEGTCLTNSILQ